MKPKGLDASRFFEVAMSKINCPNCGKIVETHKGEYRYLESGLDNVIIRGIEVFQCPCGEHSALIPKIVELHKVIASCILEQKWPLSGKEIRFLRKNMGMKATDFSHLLGVNKSTVSRWENEKEPFSEIADRLIRLLYATSMGMHEEAQKLAKNILSKIDKTHPQVPIFLMADQLGRFSCIM
jgi:putative zinc finger/helix-turn-helix YgiT family protein